MTSPNYGHHCDRACLFGLQAPKTHLYALREAILASPIAANEIANFAYRLKCIEVILAKVSTNEPAQSIRRRAKAYTEGGTGILIGAFEILDGQIPEGNLRLVSCLEASGRSQKTVPATRSNVFN